MVGVCKYAFAGKSERRPLAPTGFSSFAVLVINEEPVGARLAREGVGTNDTNPGNDKGHPKVAFVW
ncbi:hypothetical protein EMIT0P44_540018 [Pseudomonas sp. IT-P44]